MIEATAAATETPASPERRRTLMATAPLWASAPLLLAAPFFAAFRTGGYGQDTQLLIGVVLFSALALAAATSAWPPLPRGLPLAALSALVGYAVWVGLSTGWARVVYRAVQDADRVAMYCAAFAVSLCVMKVRAIRRLAGPVLLAGIVVVCAYSLAGRLLPHVVHEEVGSLRLAQPLTYWNALGMFAGFGVLIGVGLASDVRLSARLRALACAATVPCGFTAFLTLSRGVAAAVLAGLVMLVVLRRRRATLAAAAVALACIVVLALAAIAFFPDIVTLSPGTAAQVSQGAVCLAVALAATAAAGLLHARVSRSRRARGQLPLASRTASRIAVAVVPVVLGLGIAVAGHGKEKTELPSTASRITHVETVRGQYWRVALDAWRRHPLAGIGSASFAVEWSQHRGSNQPALDAHSLYIETLAELGVVGAALLLAFIGSVAVGTARAVRAAPRDATVAIAAAVLAAFAVHAGLDWDWEMPAVSLIPLILAGSVLQPRMRT
jgi:O-antigen ligase/polysaccharide polymerase Wzy-like membrane protein